MAFLTDWKNKVHPLQIMSAKRTPPDNEIMAMVEELRPFVKTGETVVPFIRRNQQRLLQLLDEESWATIARVMTALGMTYSTGKPWTARYIANEFDRATMPRKRRRAVRSEALVERPDPPPKPPADPAVPAVNTRPEIAPPTARMQPDPSPALPKKAFVLKGNPRLPPPKPLTEEDVARRKAIDDRIFGKKG